MLALHSRIYIQSWNQYLKVVYWSPEHFPTVLLSTHHIYVELYTDMWFSRSGYFRVIDQKITKILKIFQKYHQNTMWRFFVSKSSKLSFLACISLNTCLNERSTWIFWSNYVLNETDKVSNFFQNRDFFSN